MMLTFPSGEVDVQTHPYKTLAACEQTATTLQAMAMPAGVTANNYCVKTLWVAN